jgi:nucleoside 2-deoxyribosyltransferase
MGVLSKTKTYLVGPMENLDGTGWRNRVTKELSTIGVVCYDPYKKPFIRDLDEGQEVRAQMRQAILNGDLEYSHRIGKVIRAHDLNLVDRSDFIIANIHPTLASYGSAEEIFTANRAKKPIFLSVEGGRSKCPAWISWTIPPKYIYNTIDEILEVLFKIDSGRVVADSDRWRLLRKEYR